MFSFEANVVEFQGRRAISLDCYLFMQDPNPKRVILVEDTPLTGFGRLPFSYQFTEGTLSYPIDNLDIVAGPGVSVIVDNYPDALPGPANNPAPFLRVYRVQDPSLIPSLGGDIHSVDLVGSREVGPQYWLDYPPTQSTYPPNYLSVETGPSYVRIRHLYSNTALNIRVPAYTRNRSNRPDARMRFAYEIDEENGVYGSAEHPLVRIVKTPGVSVTLEARAFPDLTALARGEPLTIPALLNWWEIFEVDSINQVPPLGSSLAPQSGWRRLGQVNRAPSLSDTIAMAAFDTLVGLTPWVGDAVDLAEFAYAMGTGMDRWGRRQSTGDLVLMGVCAVLPFAAIGALRVGPRLLRQFGARSEHALRTIQDLQRVHLSQAELEALRQAEAIIRSGRRLPRNLLETYVNILNRIRRDYPLPQDFLNPEKNGFIHGELQRLYQGYLSLTRAEGRTPRGPLEWMRATRGSARQLLLELLGPNFVARTRLAGSGRMINLNAVPRPRGYANRNMASHLEFLNRDSARVMARLENYLAQRRTSGTRAISGFSRATSPNPFPCLSSAGF